MELGNSFRNFSFALYNDSLVSFDYLVLFNQLIWCVSFNKKWVWGILFLVRCHDLVELNNGIHKLRRRCLRLGRSRYGRFIIFSVLYMSGCDLNFSILGGLLRVYSALVLLLWTIKLRSTGIARAAVVARSFVILCGSIKLLTLLFFFVWL